jgi:ABC-type branched-subunit amino acid transport system substrate-binding protein
VQLLGAAGWNHHGIVDEAEQLTDNAVFCDSFFPDDSDPKARDFVRRFYRQHREPPSPFEAEVFVAAMVLKRAMRADSSHTRNGVSQTLRDMRSFRSATGMLRFSEQGDIRQDIVILTVDRDQIRPRNSEAEERVIRRQDR